MNNYKKLNSNILLMLFLSMAVNLMLIVSCKLMQLHEKDMQNELEYKNQVIKSLEDKLNLPH